MNTLKEPKTAVCLESLAAERKFGVYNSDVFPQWKNKLFIRGAEKRRM